MFWIFHSALSVQEDIYISFLSVRLMERQVGREANGSRNKKKLQKRFARFMTLISANTIYSERHFVIVVRMS